MNEHRHITRLQRALVRGGVASGLLWTTAVFLATPACSSDGGGTLPEEALGSITTELTQAQRMARYAKMRDAAAARGIDHTGYLLAGIAYAETGLAHCWSEATWACQGPNSPDCGGGPVIAGASDGPCSAQQGGLGMFQFDAGTFTDTLNKYGSDVLTVAGNTSHAIDYAINMVKISAYTTNAETDAKALQWIVNFDIHNGTQRDQWIKTVTHYYNGCAPSYSCWSQRYAHYNSSLQSVIDESGLGFWVVSPCTCSAGQTQQEGCGACGHRSRSCDSTCHWGPWGACTGQGECTPGATQQQACCDCGTHSRTCSSNCSWGAFGACEGPDPAGGNQECETGEPGPCAPGILRCVSGCRTCRRIYDPQPERCDDIDNDCSGQADEGQPATMGDPPPKMAARLVDLAVPQMMGEGERGSGWAVFRNEGQLTWQRGSLWLEATSTWSEEASPLHDPDTWPAYDVAAVPDQVVAPGEEAMLPFMIRVRDDAQTVVNETFHLVDDSGAALKCPAVSFTAGVRVKSGQSPSGRASPSSPAATDSESGCSVSSARDPHPGWQWPALLLTATAVSRLRRRSRRG